MLPLIQNYDSASEEKILDSGRLQSKERRIRKAKKGEKVLNKSSKMDDEPGNTDHVFFFAEYEEDDKHPSKFRNTRFGGKADESDVILNSHAHPGVVPNLRGKNKYVDKRLAGNEFSTIVYISFPKASSV